MCVLEKNIIEDINGHLFGTTTTTIMLIELVCLGSGRKYTNLGWSGRPVMDLGSGVQYRWSSKWLCKLLSEHIETDEQSGERNVEASCMLDLIVVDEGNRWHRLINDNILLFAYIINWHLSNSYWSTTNSKSVLIVLSPAIPSESLIIEKLGFGVIMEISCLPTSSAYTRR